MNPFNEHLHDADETYLQHFKNAIRYATGLTFSGLACYIHAFLPFLFKTNASDCVIGLYDELKARREHVDRQH